MISHGNLAEGAVNIVPFAGDIVLSDRITADVPPTGSYSGPGSAVFCLVAGIGGHTSDTTNVTKIMQAYHPAWLLVVPRTRKGI